MIADALKKALLQAAIQGKLTEQLPEDGDARDLLKEIRKEKARLIKEGKIKKEKPLPEIKEEEIPFDIPENWVWVRLGEFSKIINGFTPLRSKSNFWDSQDIPWFTVKDIRDQGHFIDHTQEYISNEAINGSERIVKANSVLLCCTASIGEFAYTKIDLTTNQQFNGITINSLFEPFITPLYIYYYVQTITERLVSEAGKTTFPFLSTKKLANFTVPIAPLSEQKRIVEKIEELMPEIEDLKVEEKKLDNLEKTFPGKIRASILQAAIQGKLTEQLPGDGDARDLLKEIQKEKARLIREGKIKEKKPLPEITEDEIPFDIPNNWVWVRFGEMIQIISGTSFSKNDTNKQDIRIIRGGNIDDNSNKLLLLDDDTYVSAHLRDKEKEPLIGDIIIVGSTGSKKVIGKPAFIDRVYENVQIGAFLRIIRPTFLPLSEYLKIIISSEYYREHVRNLAQGTNINNVKTSYLTDFIIPLPPLLEQKRMVDKVKKVLEQCKSLETASN